MYKDSMFVMELDPGRTVVFKVPYFCVDSEVVSGEFVLDTTLFFCHLSNKSQKLLKKNGTLLYKTDGLVLETPPCKNFLSPWRP